MELYDPYSHALHEDPYSVYRTLRDEYPVYWNDDRKFWALSRFADVWTAVHDPLTYSSEQGIVVDSSTESASDFLPMIITQDPPRHDELRSLVSRAFTPKRMAAMDTRVVEVARDLLTEIGPRGKCDFVQEFAAPLPTMVIADMLGVSREDRAQFRHWSDEIIQADAADPELSAKAVAAGAELYEYFGGIIAERRKTPGEDLVTALIAAEIDGERLTENELLGFCFLLLVAGNETTTNLITNASVLLFDHPDQRRDLINDTSLYPTAIEEFLRYDSPVQGLARTLTKDMTVASQPLATGDKVLLIWGSANRDEREFPDPDRFDIRRKFDRHMAFGHGVHYCLGAALARLECRIAFQELFPYMPEYTVGAPETRERLHSGPIRGYLHLPVEFEAFEVQAN